MQEEHFAIGLVAEVRPDALPAGLHDEDPAEYVPAEPRQITAIGEDGTFEVDGWWWEPTDLSIVPATPWWKR